MASPRHRRWNQGVGRWAFWDSEREQEYFYNPRSDRLDYPDGSRPRIFPRADYEPPPPEPQQASSSSTSRPRPIPASSLPAPNFNQSPPTGTAEYVSGHRRGSSENAPPPGYPRQPSGTNPVAATTWRRTAQPNTCQQYGQSPPQQHAQSPPRPTRPLSRQQGSQNQGSGRPPPEQNAPQGPSAGAFDPRGVIIYNENLNRTAMVPAAQQELAALFPDYILRARRFFVVGRVFMVLWAEPAGENATTNVPAFERPDSSLIPARFKGEMVYSKVRRFVVIREADDHCNVIPIVSYGGQGVGKRGVKKSDHAIIHTTTDPPRELAGERPGPRENGMRSPIRIVSDNVVTIRLDEQSRLNYSKVSSIPHNVKVKPVGVVHPNSMRRLRSDFDDVWRGQGRRDLPSSDSSDSDDDPKGKKPARNTTRSKGKGKEAVRDDKGSSSKGKEATSSRCAVQAGGAGASGQPSSSRLGQSQAPIDPAAATWARKGVEGYLQQGLSMDQAVATLARSLQRATPGRTLDSAISGIRELLAQYNSLLAQQKEDSSDESER
ncbi:hypothetical protein TI39_contig4218g00004 [Zymoseptoria brevis]|uniref:DUF6590 domain-containing protein n=1 Tax=Zymoseptoria brevis TaxID=1047168 RepID=A0A0F4G9N0_9PEZI|nr:hypothetical protein TI39_contig4218g00004 [Zymoseptoria brevis]